MILVVSLVASNLILALLVVVALLKIARISQVAKPENRKSPRVSKKLEKSIESEVEKLMASFSRRIDAKVAEYFAKLVDDATKKGTELSSFVEKQQAAIVSETQLLVAQDIERVREDIEKFRAEKFVQIENQINQMVLEVSKQVLGKAIDASTHEELVKDALEKAKKENFF